MDLPLAESRSTSEEVQTEIHKSSDNLKLYDFRHPRLINKEVKKVLQKIHEAFCKNLNLIFLNTLGSHIDFSLTEIREVVTADYIGSLESPAAVFLFNIEELGDWAIMDIDPGFCIYLVEKQSGSSNFDVSQRRALTKIEEGITMRIMRRVFRELCYAWAPYLGLTIQNIGYTSKPTNIRSQSSSEPGILAAYKFEIDSQILSLNFCYPFSLIREYGSSLDPMQGNTDKSTVRSYGNHQLEQQVKSIDLPVRAILGKTRMRMNSLVNIKAGDTIKLDQLISEPLNVEINKTKKLTAFPGTIDGYKAIKIYDVPKK